jgi:putative ABC transport system permease protein
MLASGFTMQKIQSIIFRENIRILVWGMITGISSALVATLPSLKSGNAMPWASLALLIVSLIASGTIAVLVAVKSIRSRSLVTGLRFG